MFSWKIIMGTVHGAKWKNSTEMWQFPTQPTTVMQWFPSVGWCGALFWRCVKRLENYESQWAEIFFPPSLCLLRAVILYPAVQLMMKFKISCRLYPRRRLPAWSESCICSGWFISLPLCMSLCISVPCVRAHVLVAGLELSRMVFDKWQAALQKAAMRWLTRDLLITEV